MLSTCFKHQADLHIIIFAKTLVFHLIVTQGVGSSPWSKCFGERFATGQDGMKNHGKPNGKPNRKFHRFVYGRMVCCLQRHCGWHGSSDVFFYEMSEWAFGEFF